MRAVVIGDALLDVDVDGSAGRLSPDGPVPVVDVESRRERAGGAGLVATFLATAGVDTTIVAAFGDDPAAERLRGLLRGVRLAASRLDGPTPVKTRVRAHGHPVARLDEGAGAPPPIELAAGTRDALAALGDADVVVAADYGRGMLASPEVRTALARVAGAVPIVWDPHPRGPVPVPGVRLATPNRDEAARFAALDIVDLAGAIEAADRLRGRWRAEAVAVTLAERGAVLADGGRPLVLPVAALADADPCGAGDRLAAEAAVALGGGADTEEALSRGVARAAAFLRAGGVASLGPGRPVPIRHGSDAFAVADAVRAAGGTVVATGGCFDLLHAGHVRTLQAARSMGDCLVVCLNSDASVRRLKGPERPIIAEADRVQLLTALECVDAVLVFEEDTPAEVLGRLAPDVWVKGGDHRDGPLPEASVVAAGGGVCVSVPYHPARSSSALVAALAAVG